MPTQAYGRTQAVPSRGASIWRSRLGWPTVRRALLAERGTATVEFCMVLPVLLFLILILVQSTLLMVGNQFVHYAAFAATRSAIVYIPQDYPYDGEPRNYLIPEPGTQKFDAIRAAAYLAVAPVGGKSDGRFTDINTAGYVSGLSEYLMDQTGQEPRWVDRLAEARLQYAAEHTEVQVLTTTVEDDEVELDEVLIIGHKFAEREAVTVRIEHEFNLSVPYVRAIFADGEHSGGGRYALVTAQYTLTNEGMDPELPPAPSLPRNTR